MIDFQHIKTMLAETDESVVTLYLHVDPAHQPNQNTPPAWRIQVKNALRDIKANHAIDEDTWKSINQQIDPFLQDYRPTGKSLVMFVGEDTFHTHDLPIVLEHRHAYGDPDVVPLLWAIDEYERYLVVLIDQERARFMSAYLGSANLSEEMSIDFDEYDFREQRYINASTGASEGATPSAQGATRDKYDDMHRAHLKRFYNDVAEATREAMREIDAERLILAGSEKSAHAVKEALHQSVREQIVGILASPTDAQPHEVADAILEVTKKYEREKEKQLVDEVVGFAKANGRGALGEDAIRQAFERQQVEMLIVPFPNQANDLAAELTLMALEHNADVELVHGAPAHKLGANGGFAARLYYTFDEATAEEA